MKFQDIYKERFGMLSEVAGGPPPPPVDPEAEEIPADAVPVEPGAEEVPPPVSAEPTVEAPSDIQQVRLSGAERLRRALTMTRDEIDDQDFAMLGVEVTPSNLDKMEKDLHRIIDSYPEVDAGPSGPGIV